MKKILTLAAISMLILGMLLFAVSCKKDENSGTGNTDTGNSGYGNVTASDFTNPDSDGKADDEAAGGTDDASEPADEMTEYQP